MENYELRNEFIAKVKKERSYNIPENYNVQRDPDYADWLENKIISDEYCMPDNINSKEEHEEYLKTIGHEKHAKMLQYFYDTYRGLYAIDFDPKELIERFNNSQSDAHSIECAEYEKLLKDWNKWIDNKNIGKGPFYKLK